MLSTPSPWLRALVANVQDAIVVLDSSGRVVFESPSACDILGIEPSDVLGAFGLERIHPAERERVIESFRRTIESPESVSRSTYRFRRADGSWQHLEALAKNLLHEPYLRGVLITFRDVTDKVLAVEAAERAGRARDEFLSRMSHELRTPLHGILGWSQLLLDCGIVEVREAAEHIFSAGEHLLKLVEEALDLAAVREGRIQIEIGPVDVESVIEDAIDLIRPLADRRDVQLIRSHRKCERLHVRADPSRLRQVLLNLLSNAVKYNRYAGEVEIGCGATDSGRARIRIRDTGPGIPEASLPRVFERYERLGAEESGVGGTGLGLAIAARLVELMGGTVGVESRPGEGALFWVELERAGDDR